MHFQTLVFLVGTFAFLLISIGVILRRTAYRTDAQGFWKDVGIPLTTPLVISLLGVAFGYFADAQKAHDYDNQKKAELLREVVASNDRPDIAFVTAVGDRLVMHLKRRDKILAQITGGNLDEATSRDLRSSQQFEERAAYFFFGMFHSALIDFYASKGYQLYPRLWMESAFDGLCNRVDKLVYGDRDAISEMPGVEESALYKYFGAAAGTFKNITNLLGEPTKAAVLFDFNIMLDEAERPDKSKDEYQRQLEKALLNGFIDFQRRLNGNGPRAIDARKLQLTIAAITALDDYAFNKLFGVWYKGSDTSNSPAEVKSLDIEIPAMIQPNPPSEYLFYPIRGWEGEDVKRLREETWQIIFTATPTKFKASAKASSSPGR